MLTAAAAVCYSKLTVGKDTVTLCDGGISISAYRISLVSQRPTFRDFFQMIVLCVTMKA